jgi:hypothetical protein
MIFSSSSEVFLERASVMALKRESAVCGTVERFKDGSLACENKSWWYEDMNTTTPIIKVKKQNGKLLPQKNINILLLNKPSYGCFLIVYLSETNRSF